MATSDCCPHGRQKVYCDKINNQFFLLALEEIVWLDVVFCPWCGSMLDSKKLTDKEPYQKKTWIQKILKM